MKGKRHILPGPVQAIRKTPPPARRGSTVADQVHQLVSASEADASLGFMARMMALCSLPRTNPGNQHRRECTRMAMCRKSITSTTKGSLRSNERLYGPGQRLVDISGCR